MNGFIFGGGWGGVGRVERKRALVSTLMPEDVTREPRFMVRL